LGFSEIGPTPACFSEQGGPQGRGGVPASQITEKSHARSTRKMLAEIPQECTKPDAFTIKWGDIPNMVDAVFDGDYKMPGWVLMFANTKGCGHVDGLFPEAHIKWYELPSGLPYDWRGMRVNLPEVVSAPKQTCRLKSSRPGGPSTIAPRINLHCFSPLA
jgi:hypothetical protein